MNARSSNKSNPAETQEDRDPAEVRAEKFRVAAQRETVEAFVVAFILALLFRAFLAEAFVIPTGSMAPTLMGAHKDLVCDRCGYSFQVGASRERSGPDTELVVVGGICSNCRHVNSLDLKDNGDHATFNGDRILVNKFTYLIGDPERWDVIVFKYPGNPKQNYIKRLVGLPNETLSIRHGDVYVRPTGSNDRSTVLRKPPQTLLAMSHLVYDTDYQSDLLIKANYPSRWQPWNQGARQPPTNSWQVERSTDGLAATVEASADEFQWLRYFHRFPTDSQWAKAEQGMSLSNIDPYRSRAITDFYAYDSYIHVRADEVFDSSPSVRRGSGLERALNNGYSKGIFNARYKSGGGPEQFGERVIWGGQDNGQQLGRDGLHWVGDLIMQADVETSPDAKEILLELVEAGVKYQCRVDLNDGSARMIIDDVEPRTFDDGTESPTASTEITAGSRHEIRFSNCDDQLLLWVDGDVVEFDQPTTFDSRGFRTDLEDHPQYVPAHPLDAAPAAIAVRGGNSTIRHLEIRRDQYYVATNNSNFGGIIDYAGGVALGEIQKVFALPQAWSEFTGWQTRREVTFELDEEQFFPMGDNSPESLDARCWAGTKDRIKIRDGANEDAWRWSDESYVPRDLLVGKAILVFWPHSWNSPVPFTPNVKRMKRIR